jgi:hypothetical protein
LEANEATEMLAYLAVRNDITVRTNATIDALPYLNEYVRSIL